MRLRGIIIALIVSISCSAQVKEDSLWATVHNTDLADSSRGLAARVLSHFYLTETYNEDKVLSLVDSIYRIGRKTNDDILLASAYARWSYYHNHYTFDDSLMQLHNDSAIYYYLKAHAFIEASYMLTQQSTLYFNQGLFKKAKQSQIHATNLLHEHGGSPYDFYESYYNLALTHSNLGLVDSTILYLDSAYHKGVELQSPELQMEVLSMIAQEYIYKHDSAKAQNYIQKAEQIYEEGMNPYILVSYIDVKRNYCNLTQKVGDCKELALRVKNLAYTTGDSSIIYRTYGIVAKEFYQEGAYLDSALWYANKAYEFGLKNELSHVGFSAGITLCHLALTNREYSKVISYGEQLEKSHWELVEKEELFDLMYHSYEQLRNYQKALEYHQKMFAARDSLTSNNNYRALLKKEEAFQYALKEESLKAKLLLEQQISKNRKILLLVSGGVLLLLFTIALLIHKNLNKTKKAKQVIEEANLQKTVLLKEIHHRVKNNLQLISSLLKIQHRNLDDDKMKAVFEESQVHIESMALLHKKLYQFEDLSLIPFKEYLNDLTEVFNNLKSYDNKKVSIEASIPEQIKFDIDTAIPIGLICAEILSNSFKHAFTKVDSPSIQIQLKNVAEDNYQLIISDNGLGMDVENKLSEKQGLGMQLVESLAKQLFGKVQYQFKDGWSTFTIHFLGQKARLMQD